jgi:hypothetical protein
MHPKRKITGYRPTAARENFRIIEGQINRAPRAALAPTKSAANRKRPTFTTHFLPNSRIEF